jgi:hypothetical protein
VIMSKGLGKVERWVLANAYGSLSGIADRLAH